MVAVTAFITKEKECESEARETDEETGKSKLITIKRH
jgi:hypothetical protein